MCATGGAESSVRDSKNQERRDAQRVIAVRERVQVC